MRGFLKDLQIKLKASFEDEKAFLLKKRQSRLFFGILGTMGIVVVFFLFKDVFFLSKPIVVEKVDGIQKIATSRESVDPKKVWVERLESEMDGLKKKNDEMEKLISTMTQKLMAYESFAGIGVQNQDQKSFKESISKKSLFPGNTLNSTHLDQKPLDDQIQEESFQKPDTFSSKSTKITKLSFNLQSSTLKKINKSIDHYVPSGTFVRGRLTSGVVASTAVSSSSDPQPIHMELTDFGTLPRNFKTDLKKCFLIGSAYGDLPSERVFMRLETLSCVERRTEEVIELKVDGYVSGEDGVNGMRGHVVDRSGPAMRNAFMGGFIGGMGQFLSEKNGGSTQISPMGVTSQQAINATEMLKGGAGKGIGNAFSKLSDFYIKRAEQLQPVIEIEPGREIDVVFKTGFDMNQTLYRQHVKNQQDKARMTDMAQHFD